MAIFNSYVKLPEGIHLDPQFTHEEVFSPWLWYIPLPIYGSTEGRGMGYCLQYIKTWTTMASHPENGGFSNSILIDWRVLVP